MTLTWYDKFSYFHDLLNFNDWAYRDARQMAVDALNLSEGDIVFDLFCGTGLNFKPLLRQLDTSGKIIGIDGSSGMLARAGQRIRRNAWGEHQIVLLEKDLLNLHSDFVADYLPKSAAPKVLITLALSIFENYEDVFTNIIAVMPPGTRFALMDVYCPEYSLGAQFLNRLGDSDCSRKVWEPLKARTTNYFEKMNPLRFRLTRGSLVVAAGTKEEEQPVPKVSHARSAN